MDTTPTVADAHRPDARTTQRRKLARFLGLWSLLAMLVSVLVAAPQILPTMVAARVADDLRADDPADELGALDERATATPRVLVFYDAASGGADTCVECKLHALRFAYYAFQFRQAGAEVLGVVGGLRDGSTRLEAGLELPWTPVYDLSGRLADYYGIERHKNANPAIVVLDAEGRVRYRGQPRGVDDRIEAEVLTSIAAVVAERDDALVSTQ